MIASTFKVTGITYGRVASPSVSVHVHVSVKAKFNLGRNSQFPLSHNTPIKYTCRYDSTLVLQSVQCLILGFPNEILVIG